jgi:phosphoribosyl-dephospho-CoA transferase
MGVSLPRHTLVTATPAGWQAMLATRPDLAGEPMLWNWADDGGPLVVRQRQAEDAPDVIPLGLVLPPALGKRRLALGLRADAIATISPPPLLSAAIRAAPEAWRPMLAEIVALDADVRTFGSLAWTLLTGLSYLTTASDLDLLWTFDPAGLESFLHQMEALAGRAPMRIDGEIVAPAGGVHWRELRADGEVLVNHADGVRLMSRASFLSAQPS